MEPLEAALREWHDRVSARGRAMATGSARLESCPRAREERERKLPLSSFLLYRAVMPEAASAAAVRVTIGDSEFDRDTAVTRRAPGVYDIDLSAGWTIISAVNGGYLLAVLGRALGDALPHPDPFTISAHYLTASRPGPAVVRTETVRTGRSLSTGQASLLQYDDEGNEVERIRVLASYGDLDALPDDVRTSAKRPRCRRWTSASARRTAPPRSRAARPSPTG